MKLKVITLTALTALSFGSAAFAQDEDNDRPRRHGGMRHDPIARMTESLDLTADQKAKVQPIMDEARPKMEAIHREAMEKAKVVIDDALTKIRPLLTPDQQKKLDDAKNNQHGFGGHKAQQDADGNSD